MSYSPERKEAVLLKMLPPHNLSVPSLAKMEGISSKTLYHWRQELYHAGRLMSKNNKQPSKAISAASKLAVVVETLSMNTEEINSYCRQRGLYPAEIKQWHAASLNGIKSNSIDKKSHEQEVKQCQQQIKNLERELKYKEKALAETAALLVLRKKFNALYLPEDEGT